MKATAHINKAEARLNHLRIAPRKVRIVADAIRGKKVEEAKSILGFSVKRACEPIKKLLDSAVANAKEGKGMKEEGLFISEIIVNGGPVLKRWRPRARGRAERIRKRTSRITIVLEEERENE